MVAVPVRTCVRNPFPVSVVTSDLAAVDDVRQTVGVPGDLPALTLCAQDLCELDSLSLGEVAWAYENIDGVNNARDVCVVPSDAACAVARDLLGVAGRLTPLSDAFRHRGLQRVVTALIEDVRIRHEPSLGKRKATRSGGLWCFCGAVLWPRVFLVEVLDLGGLFYLLAFNSLDRVLEAGTVIGFHLVLNVSNGLHKSGSSWHSRPVRFTSYVVHEMADLPHERPEDFDKPDDCAYQHADHGGYEIREPVRHPSPAAYVSYSPLSGRE